MEQARRHSYAVLNIERIFVASLLCVQLLQLLLLPLIRSKTIDQPIKAHIFYYLVSFAKFPLSSIHENPVSAISKNNQNQRIEELIDAIGKLYILILNILKPRNILKKINIYIYIYIYILICRNILLIHIKI